MRDTLRQLYEARIPLLDMLAVNLEREIKQALVDALHIDRVSFRVKHPDRFLEKAQDPENKPPYGNPLVEIEDQVAGRVIVFFLSDLKVVQEKLKGTFTTVEQTHHRPKKDEEFGYESHHHICLIPPHVKPKSWDNCKDLPETFELQLRTLFMHAWAEPQHDIEYKNAGDLPPESRRELYWIAASAWGADQAYERVWLRQVSREKKGE